MLSRALADIALFAHLLWIFFLLAGVYRDRKNRPVMPLS
jgi:hypothetical protein